MPFHDRSYTLTFTAFDPSGNVDSKTQRITVEDNLAPVIYTSADHGHPPCALRHVASAIGGGTVHVEASKGFDPRSFVAACDACWGDLTKDIAITINGGLVSEARMVAGGRSKLGIGEYSVVFRVVDGSGNAAEATQYVSVTDTIGPNLALVPPVVTLQHGQPFDWESGISVSDAYWTAAEIKVVAGDVPAGLERGAVWPGTYRLHYTATDVAGNTAARTRDIVVEDRVAPIVYRNGNPPCGTEPPYAPNPGGWDAPDDDAVVEAGNGYYPRHHGAVKACDAVDGAVGVSLAINGGATSEDDMVAGGRGRLPVGLYKVVYSAIDAASNPTSVSRTITVVDRTPPVITLFGEPEMFLEANLQPYEEAGARMDDFYEGGVDHKMTRANDINERVPGEYTVRFNGQDAARNVAATVIRVVNVIDTVAPIVWFGDKGSPCATRNLDPSGYTAAQKQEQASVEAENTLAEAGVSLDLWAGLHACDNANDQHDGIGAADLTAQVQLTVVGNKGTSAADFRDSPLGVPTTGAVAVYGQREYLIDYRLTDTSGHETTVRRTITWLDRIKPQIQIKGSNPVIVEAGVLYKDAGMTCTDTYDPKPSCDLALGWADECVPRPFSARCDPPGFEPRCPHAMPGPGNDWQVTFTSVDLNGNKLVVYRAVTVRDTTPPTIHVLGKERFSLEGGDDAAYHDEGVVACDTNDGEITQRVNVRCACVSGRCERATVGCSPPAYGVDVQVPGVFTVTYSVEDAAAGGDSTMANGATQTREVIVTDTRAPVFTLLGKPLIDMQAGDSYTDDYVSVYDFVDPVHEMPPAPSQPVATYMVDTYAAGAYTIVYTVSDFAGNAAVPVSRTVRVKECTHAVALQSGEKRGMAINEGPIEIEGFGFESGVDYRLRFVDQEGNAKTTTPGEVVEWAPSSVQRGNMATAGVRIRFTSPHWSFGEGMVYVTLLNHGVEVDECQHVDRGLSFEWFATFIKTTSSGGPADGGTRFEAHGSGFHAKSPPGFYKCVFTCSAEEKGSGGPKGNPGSSHPSGCNTRETHPQCSVCDDGCCDDQSRVEVGLASYSGEDCNRRQRRQLRERNKHGELVAKRRLVPATRRRRMSAVARVERSPNAPEH